MILETHTEQRPVSFLSFLSGNIFERHRTLHDQGTDTNMGRAEVIPIPTKAVFQTDLCSS